MTSVKDGEAERFYEEEAACGLKTVRACLHRGHE